jgi:N-acetylneuraminic acid mutarotase
VVKDVMRINGRFFVAAMVVAMGALTLPACSDQSLTAPAPVVTATAPSIVTQPKSKAVNAGQSASFSVSASGSDPLTYQWSRNGTAVPGATSSTYTLSPATASDDAASFTAAVTNSAGSATSSAAVLTVHSGAFSAASGVAQKGPMISGSKVTAQELDAALAPTGSLYSYKTSALGTFSPGQLFAQQYVGLTATGFYFDEVANQTSSGPVTLNGYCDLGAASVLNVNVLTTLAYQRIQNLVTGSHMSFADAQTQAQNEVLAALGIPYGSSYGAAATLDLAKGADGDNILAAVSSLFVYGNNAGAAASLMAAFQSDIAVNGAVTMPATRTALTTAAAGLNPGAVAANLTQKYSSAGTSFSASDIGQWIDVDAAGVVGRFKFQVTNATSASSFAFPAFVTGQAAGQSVSVSAGQLAVNGVAASGPVTLNPGDALTLTPATSAFGPNGVLSAFLTNGTDKLARVLFLTATADVWLPATPLLSPRTHHTAVTLPGGKVLVAGGIGPNRVYASAELFDPATATWSAAGNLGAARFYHSAVVLANGKVLAVGGYGADNHTVLGSAELYDPAGNTWSPAGSLATARIEHTATLLPGGKVLVVGGQGGTAASFASAELYDPATNSWSAAGSLASPRSNHTATLLANGKVLVAGGSNLGVTSPLATAELYDPATNSWSPAGDLGAARSGHTATLLQNGRVLVSGGFDNAGSVSLATAELYDPASNSFAPTGSLAASRSVHAATLLPNGKVLVSGGQSQASGASAVALASAELFDPSSGAWSPAASMATRRGYFTASLLQGGAVLAAGGQPGSGIAESVEIYW